MKTIQIKKYEVEEFLDFAHMETGDINLEQIPEEEMKYVYEFTVDYGDEKGTHLLSKFCVEYTNNRFIIIEDQVGTGKMRVVKRVNTYPQMLEVSLTEVF